MAEEPSVNHKQFKRDIYLFLPTSIYWSQRRYKEWTVGLREHGLWQMMLAEELEQEYKEVAAAAAGEGEIMSGFQYKNQKNKE